MQRKTNNFVTSAVRSHVHLLPLLAAGLAIISVTAMIAACLAKNGPTVPDDPEVVSPLMIGQSAPAFDLPRADRNRYRFVPDALDAPVIIVFYRGGWCPYCAAHFMELRKAEDKVREMGYELVFISPDRPEKLAESLTQLDADYTLLSDSDMEAAKAFGVAFKVDDATIAR